MLWPFEQVDGALTSMPLGQPEFAMQAMMEWIGHNGISTVVNEAATVMITMWVDSVRDLTLTEFEQHFDLHHQSNIV